MAIKECDPKPSAPPTTSAILLPRPCGLRSEVALARKTADIKARVHVDGLCGQLWSHRAMVVSAHCEVGVVSSDGVGLERELWRKE